MSGTPIPKHGSSARLGPGMAGEFSKVSLEKAGEKAPLIMYGSQVDDLKTARLQTFQRKVATAAALRPEKLPVTSDAARFHSHCLSPGARMERERSL